jgi:hypothetical protein
MKFCLMFCTTVFSLLVAASLQAAPITVPTDLNPGDTYRLAFVTFGTRNATDVLIGPYNDFVTTAAAGVPELAALGTTWKAIGSTALTDARDNTGTNPIVSTGVPLYRLDDTRIANNNADLWDGDILASLQVYETGVFAGGAPQVWTGTGSTGQEAGSFGIGSTNVGVGSGDQTDDDWVANGAAGNQSHRAWYAVSSVLTVVPELPGDLNGDGAVNAIDAGTMFSNWGLVGLDCPDGNIVSGGADAIDAGDAGVMFTNWTGDAGPLSAATAIPEPTTLTLATLALVGLCCRPRSRRR